MSTWADHFLLSQSEQPAKAIRELHLRERIAHFQGHLDGAQVRFKPALTLAQQNKLQDKSLSQLNNLGTLFVE